MKSDENKIKHLADLIETLIPTYVESKYVKNGIIRILNSAYKLGEASKVDEMLQEQRKLRTEFALIRMVKHTLEKQHEN